MVNIIVLILLLVPLAYFINERRKNRKIKGEQLLETRRRESLDAILKNNKDRSAI